MLRKWFSLFIVVSMFFGQATGVFAAELNKDFNTINSDDFTINPINLDPIQDSYQVLPDNYLNLPNPNLNVDVLTKEIKLHPNIKVFNKDFLTKVSEIKPNQITLDTSIDPSSFNSGDIFTLPPTEEHPSGLAQKVVSKVNQNGQTVLETIKPKFKEVFTQLKVESTAQLNAEDFDTASLPDGIEIVNQADVSSNSQFQMLDTTTENNSDEVVINFEGFKVTDKATLTGSITLKKPAFHNQVEIRTQVLDEAWSWVSGNDDTKNVGAYGKAEFTTGEAISVNLKVDGSFDHHSELKLGTVYVPLVTGVGAEGDFYLLFDMDGDIKLDIDFDHELDLKAGAKFSGLSVQPYSDLTVKNNFEPTLKGNLNAKLGIGADLHIDAASFDVLGINFEGGLDGGLKGEVKNNQNCTSYDLDAYLQYRAYADVEVFEESISGKALADLLNGEKCVEQSDDDGTYVPPINPIDPIQLNWDNIIVQNPQIVDSIKDYLDNKEKNQTSVVDTLNMIDLIDQMNTGDINVSEVDKAIGALENAIGSKVWDSKKGVKKAKKWHVKFNTKMDPISVSDFMYVTDSTGTKLSNINIQSAAGSNNKEFVLMNPNGYQTGETYYLHLPKKIESDDDVQMENSVKMKFTIKN